MVKNPATVLQEEGDVCVWREGGGGRGGWLSMDVRKAVGVPNESGVGVGL